MVAFCSHRQREFSYISCIFPAIIMRHSRNSILAVHNRSSHTNQQRFQVSPEQDQLCGWISEQEACGYAPTHKLVREIAVFMLKVSGDDEPLGKRWVQNFLKRNPRVATLLGKPIESSRIRGTQP